MRGTPQAQPECLTVLNLNAAVPAHHPLRTIKRQIDSVLRKLSGLFDELYEELGRPSIPPEPRLKPGCRWRTTASLASSSSANRSATIGVGPGS